MATKAYGQLVMPSPVVNASGGDVTAVNDATQQNYPLGGVYLYVDSSGRPRVVKYVQFNPTAAPTYAQGAPVYYKDNTRTIVTNKVSEALTYAASKPEALFSFAGILLNATAPTTGNFCFIQCAGFCDKIKFPASTAAGDILVLSNAANAAPGDNTLVRVAAGTDVGIIKAIAAAIYLTDVAAGGGGLGGGWIAGPIGGGIF